MLQHRHVWNDGTFSNWHDAKRTHTGKGPDGLYEDDAVFEEREFTPGTRTRKAKDPLYAYAPEYGPTKEEQLYQNAPEYAAA